MVDFDQCAAIDHSYLTSRVWQMDFNQSNAVATSRFQLVALPQALRVHYPYSSEQLILRWCQAHCFLVAEKDSLIYAYITAILDQVNGTVWIDDMAITLAERRQGYGSELLRVTRQWAKREGATRLLAAVQTKNYPGTQFCQKNGLSFCGYNESWYHSGDIALFFGATL